MKGPLNTCLKDRYTLIEQSDLNTLIEQSQYSSEEQCSKLIDKEIWLVMGSYCHCQQVVTFFFFFFFGLHLTTWVKGPTLTLCPGPLNFSGRPWLLQLYARTNRYSNSFLPRSIPDWNNLDMEDLDNIDLLTFKNRLQNA